MKSFFIILAAAVMILIAMSAYRISNESMRRTEELRQLRLNNDLAEAKVDWSEQVRADPQFDPSGERLRERLKQIMDADGAGKSPPPNPWKQK